MNSPAIEKIKKLLALAQSDVPAERDLALSKAIALATENQIDLALMDLSDVGVLKDEPMIKDDFTHKVVKIRPVEHRFVSSILRDFFNIDIVWCHRGQWSFIGKKGDVEFAKWLCGFLIEEFNRRWSYYRQAELYANAGLTPARAQAYKNTFMYGCYQGLNQKLVNAKRETENVRFTGPVVQRTPESESQTTSDLRSRYALVVQNETTKREEAKKNFFPSLTKSRSRGISVRSHGTLSAGRAAGSSINCNRAIAA